MSARVVVNLESTAVFWDKGPHEAQWILCRTLASLIQAVAAHSSRTRTTKIGTASSPIQRPTLSRNLMSLLRTLGHKLDINVDLVDEHVDSSVAYLPKAEEPTHDLHNLADRIVSFAADSDPLPASSFDCLIADRSMYGMEGSFIDEAIVCLRNVAINQYTLMTMRALALVDEEVTSMRATASASMQNTVVKDPIVRLRGGDFSSDAPIDVALTAADLADLANHGGTVCVFGSNTWPSAKALLRKICVSLKPISTIGCLEIDDNNALFDALGDKGHTLHVVRDQHSGLAFPTMSCVVTDNESDVERLIDLVPHSPTRATVAFLKRAGDCAHGSHNRISVVALPPMWAPDDVMPRDLGSILREAAFAIFVCPDEVIANVHQRMAARIQERWCCAPRNIKQGEIECEESRKMQDKRAQKRIPLKVIVKRLEALREADKAQKRKRGKKQFHFWVRPPMVPPLCGAKATPAFPSFEQSSRPRPPCAHSDDRTSAPRAVDCRAVSPPVSARKLSIGIPFFSGSMHPRAMIPPPPPLALLPAPSMPVPLFARTSVPPAPTAPVLKGVCWASSTSTPTVVTSPTSKASARRTFLTREQYPPLQQGIIEQHPPQQHHCVPLGSVESANECSPISQTGSLPMSPLTLHPAKKGSPAHDMATLAASPARRRTPKGDATRRHSLAAFDLQTAAEDGAWRGDGEDGEQAVTGDQVDGVRRNSAFNLLLAYTLPKTKVEQAPTSPRLRSARRCSGPAGMTRDTRAVANPGATIAHVARQHTISPDASAGHQPAPARRAAEDEISQAARESTRRPSGNMQVVTATPRRTIAKVLKAASDIVDSCDVGERKALTAHDAEAIGKRIVPSYMRSTSSQLGRTLTKKSGTWRSETRSDLSESVCSQKRSELSSVSSAVVSRKSRSDAARVAALSSKFAPARVHKRDAEAVAARNAARGKAPLHGSGRLAGREDGARIAARHAHSPTGVNSLVTSHTVPRAKMHPKTARGVGSIPLKYNEAVERPKTARGARSTPLIESHVLVRPQTARHRVSMPPAQNEGVAQPQTLTSISDEAQKPVTSVPSTSISLMS